MKEDRKPALILIAEDDQEMRSLLRDELYDWGCPFKRRLMGTKLFKWCWMFALHCILTDLRMPAGA